MPPTSSDSKMLDGQVAIVTGAGRGIGRSVSLAIARAGARVALAARSEDQLAAVEREISAAGGRAVAIPTDVSSEEDVQRLFSRASEELGPPDILVNNAGVGSFGPAVKLAVSELDRIYSVNVRGTFLCSREALRAFQPRKRGFIVNVASVVGIKGYPGQSAYTASKHAVMGLTKSLAAEAQEHGVRVCAVLPGGVDTDMIGDARPDLDRAQLLQPEDVARTVLFLLTLPARAAIDEIYIRRSASKPF